MKNEPCAKFTIRVTPKMMERPEDTRNSVEAYEHPLRNCASTCDGSSIGDPDGPGCFRSSRSPYCIAAAGRRAFTKALSGWKSLPSA